MIIGNLIDTFLNRNKTVSYGITGSWRLDNQFGRYPLERRKEILRLKNDVRKVVDKIVDTSGKLYVGGALGVDEYATDKLLERTGTYNLDKRLQILLPASFTGHLDYFGEVSTEVPQKRIISRKTAERITNQLMLIMYHAPNVIVESEEHDEVNEESYFARNEALVSLVDRLYAFQDAGSKGVGSEGVQHAIDLARKAGKPTFVKRYDSPNTGWVDKYPYFGTYEQEFNVNGRYGVMESFS